MYLRVICHCIFSLHLITLTYVNKDEKCVSVYRAKGTLWFAFGLHHHLAVWLWTGYLTTLSFVIKWVDSHFLKYLWKISWDHRGRIPSIGPTICTRTFWQMFTQLTKRIWKVKPILVSLIRWMCAFFITVYISTSQRWGK